MGIKLSACTITKNEAENIKRSIDSYKEYVDEIIVVDTGSVDDTVEIAKKAGAKVLNFKWENDFAAAKNFAIDNCTGDWIVFLDADEWFDKDDAKNIRDAIKFTVEKGYPALSCKLVNFADEDEILEVGCILRVFKNDKNIRFERAIHEVLYDKIKNEPLESLYSNILTINHSGYMRKVLKTKAKRNKMLLDKAYAMGKATPIDYFYCLRENLSINLEMSDYFFQLIKNMPNYRKEISEFNVGPTLDDNMFKLVNKLPNKYSFEERLEVLKEAQKYFPDNPIFKYYEYNMFYNINRKRAISVLKEAIKLSETYEKENPDKINSFYASANEAFCVLGEYENLMGNKTQALDYFSNAIRIDYSNPKALNGILSIIKEQKSEDIILFLNSLYNTDNKEVMKFLVERLRLTAFHDVFLYYFVNYNKKFNEINAALFTSRLITGNFDEIIDTYLNAYNENKDNKALMLISAAIISGNRKEKYTEVSSSILPAFSKIINAYFNDEILEDVGELEFSIAFDIFKEIAFIADNETIKKYIKTLKGLNERIWVEIIRYYFNHYEYDNVKKCLEWIKEFGVKYKDLDTYVNYVLTNIYFRTGELENIEDTLDKAISGGFLDVDLVLICEILEADDYKLDYYYKLFDSRVEMKKLEHLDKLVDMNSDSIFFLNIDKFNEQINDRPIDGMLEQVKEFYNFANKALEKKAYAYAEKYFKIALQFNYCMDKCYYHLGEIYNHFNKPELSAYCYEKAFCENLLLAREILPKGHRNSNYVYSKKEEVYSVNCPICGKEGRAISVYTNIESDILDYNMPLISTYMKCEDCKHIFLKNDNKDKNFPVKFGENENANEKHIERLYNTFEEISNISDKKNIIDFSDNDHVSEIANMMGYEVIKYKKNINDTFDIVFAGEYLNNSENLRDNMKNIAVKMQQNSLAVFNVYNFENLYSKFDSKPKWTKDNVKNVFSKESISKLFEIYGLEIIKINVSHLEKGMETIWAIKK